MKRGFTLLELIVVVIILAILAGIFFPRLIKMAERAKQAEAYGQLGSIRAAQIRYFVQQSYYTGEWGDLDIDRPCPDATPECEKNPVRYFTYSIANNSARLGIAKRRCNSEQGVAPKRHPSNSGNYNYTITIDDNGTTTTDPLNLGSGCT